MSAQVSGTKTREQPPNSLLKKVMTGAAAKFLHLQAALVLTLQV